MKYGIHAINIHVCARLTQVLLFADSPCLSPWLTGWHPTHLCLILQLSGCCIHFRIAVLCRPHFLLSICSRLCLTFSTLLLYYYIAYIYYFILWRTPFLHFHTSNLPAPYKTSKDSGKHFIDNFNAANNYHKLLAFIFLYSHIQDIFKILIIHLKYFYTIMHFKTHIY